MTVENGHHSPEPPSQKLVDFLRQNEQLNSLELTVEEQERVEELLDRYLNSKREAEVASDLVSKATKAVTSLSTSTTIALLLAALLPGAGVPVLIAALAAFAATWFAADEIDEEGSQQEVRKR